MSGYLNIAQIIISAVLILAILLQAKGTGWTGFFGSPTSVFRTRRGLERTLFQLTIILAAAFIIVSILSVRMVR